MADNSLDCEASDLLFTETTSLRLGDLDSVNLEKKTHQTNNLSLVFADDGSQPLIGLPLLSEESFCLMVERERRHLPSDDYLSRLRSGGLDLGVRRQALDWIWKAHAHYSFGPLSICLSMNFLDRFLSVYELPRSTTWTVQLLAVACLSLATKMEETIVPLTVDLQVGEPRFMFEGKTIQRMELLVLSTLKWKMLACTPCSFIDYFLRKINDNGQLLPLGSLISRSIELILSTIRGIDYLEFRPSEIAAAVAMHVSEEIQAANIHEAMSSLAQVEMGRVLKCLELIQDLTLINESANVVSGASVPQSPIGVLDAVCLSYKTEDLTVGSCASSSHGSPDTKRRKPDKPSQED